MKLTPWIVMSLYVVLAAAAASDAASRRVPNALTLMVAMLGIAWQFGSGGMRAVLLAAGAAAVLLAVLLVPFSRRMLGAGDVKLMAACAVWTGFQKLPTFVLATALAGGLVALAAATTALRPSTAATPPAVDASRPLASARARIRAARVPYSIAIVAGVLIALHWSLP